jgi:hypothetical protein
MKGFENMTTVNLDELYIGVKVKDTTTYFKDLTEATLFASEKINKGYKVEMLYCDKCGCKI